MNTAKQVNIMIGLLLLSFLAFGIYYINEGKRAEAARANQTELMAHRGADLFVANCRSCHGMEGMGPDEGNFAPKLNNMAFLVLDGNNPFNLPVTPEGEARGIHDFLFETISCGRTNTAMPPWSELHGGPLSDVQINYLVTLITEARWDLVAEVGHEHDLAALDQEAAAYTIFGKAYAAPEDPEQALSKDVMEADGKTVKTPGEKRLVDKAIAYREEGRLGELSAEEQKLFAPMKRYEDLTAAEREAVDANFRRSVYADPAGLSITSKNCGQYGAATQEFRDRNPFVEAPAGGGAAPASDDPVALGQAVAGKYGCVACHTATGAASIGPTWKGLAGREAELANGQKVVADDAYIRESIENPGAKVVKGFVAGIMPQEIAKGMKPEEIDQVIAYIKSLK